MGRIWISMIREPGDCLHANKTAPATSSGSSMSELLTCVYPLRGLISANIIASASIFSVLFLSLGSTASVVRPLRDNYHFLFPITKSDV
jgi:hypothetical protein